MTNAARVSRLMQAGQYIDAASAALDAAAQYQRFGLPKERLDMLAAAAKCHHIAGEARRALDLFEQVLTEEERGLTRIPDAKLMMRRLAEWPERFARAAFAAADSGHPIRAVQLAELGRFRLLGQQLGPPVTPPASAPAPLWAKFVKQWRDLAVAAANELTDSGSQPETAAFQANLASLRNELVELGVSQDALRPPLADEPIEHQMARLPDHTAVLYSVVLGTEARFFLLSHNVAKEIRIDSEKQRAIVEDCRQFAVEIPTAPKDENSRRKLADALLDRVGTLFGEVVHSAFEGRSESRMLWVPHGALACVPISACPFGVGHVVDRLAVMEAPTLTLGTLPATRVEERSARAAFAPRGKTHTTGGDSVIRRFDPSAPDEHKVGNVHDLRAIANQAPVLFLSCHGEFVWQNPLSSKLLLADNDTTLADIIDHQVFRPDQLLILGVCESGTVRQGELNEAIGIPTAARLAGASTVVGARWKVGRHIAAAFAGEFLDRLSSGAETPDALRSATLRIKNAQASDLGTFLQEIGHPTASFVTKHARKIRISPFDWGSFVHWGAPWSTHSSS